jgi:CBS domain-containing protein
MAKVRDVMDAKVATVDSEQTVSDCVKTMTKNGVWSVVDTKGGSPSGVVTERDIIRRCIVIGKSLEGTKVEEIMSSPLITVDADAYIGDAMQLMMDKKVRRLYIMDKGKVVARLTQTVAFDSMTELIRSISSVTSLP